MAERATLKALIQAVAASIAGAQQEVERRQLLHLGSFFDKNLRPLVMAMRVPSRRPDAGPGDEDLLEAPLLSLLPYSALRIGEAQVEFDVELGDLEDGEILVRLLGEDDDSAAPRSKMRGPKAHVILKVRGAETPDGAARLLAELDKMHGSTAAPPLSDTAART